MSLIQRVKVPLFLRLVTGAGHRCHRSPFSTCPQRSSWDSLRKFRKWGQLSNVSYLCVHSQRTLILVHQPCWTDARIKFATIYVMTQIAHQPKHMFLPLDAQNVGAARSHSMRTTAFNHFPPDANYYVTATQPYDGRLCDPFVFSSWASSYDKSGRSSGNSWVSSNANPFKLRSLDL